MIANVPVRFRVRSWEVSLVMMSAAVQGSHAGMCMHDWLGGVRRECVGQSLAETLAAQVFRVLG